MSFLRHLKALTPKVRRRNRNSAADNHAQSGAGLVREVWSKHVDRDEAFFSLVILAASIRCPGIGVTLRFPDPDHLTDEETAYLNVVALKVKVFLARVIGMGEEDLKEAARQLGSRHVQFSDRKFKTVYWDVFVLAMTAALEELDPPPSPAHIYAWQKFLSTVVDQMRGGYTASEEEQRLRRRENGGSLTPSPPQDF